MMRFFKTLFVFTVACALVLAGCATNTDPGNSTAAPAAAPDNTEAAMATADEVLAAAGLTAEDLPGVDVDAFIAAEQLTAELLAQLPTDILREALLAQIIPETDSCTYLIYGETITLAEGESIHMEEIKRIAVVSANDALVPSLMIDLEAGKAYYADGFFFDDIASAAKVTNLTDELRNEVAAAVEAAGIDSWETFYTDMENATDAENERNEAAVANWVIAFETANGVIQFRVCGIDTNAPQAFFDLGVCLYNLFW